MKRFSALVLAIVVWAVAGGLAIPAWADEYDDSESHPLRLAAYVLHPVGYAMEWVIFRPFHALVSLPRVDKVFGHVSHTEEGAGYYR